MCQTAPAFLASVARRHPASLKLVLQSLPEGQNVRCTLEFRELHTLVTIKRQLHRQQGLTMEELLTQLRNAARAKAKEQQQKLPPDEQSTFDFDTAVWQECPDPGFRQTLMDHCQQWECLTQLAQCDMLSYAMRKADAPQQQAQQQQQQACQQQAAADQQQQQQAGVQPAGQQQQVRPTVAELEAEPGQHIAGVIDRSIKRTLLCKQWREALPDLAAGAPAELGGLGILTGSFRPAWRVHGQDQPYYDSDIKDGDFCIPMDLALLPCYGRYKRGRTTDDDEDESQDSNRKKKKRKRSCVTEVGKKPWEKHHLQAHNTGWVKQFGLCS